MNPSRDVTAGDEGVRNKWSWTWLGGGWGKALETRCHKVDKSS